MSVKEWTELPSTARISAVIAGLLAASTSPRVVSKEMFGMKFAPNSA